MSERAGVLVEGGDTALAIDLALGKSRQNVLFVAYTYARGVESIAEEILALPPHLRPERQTSQRWFFVNGSVLHLGTRDRLDALRGTRYNTVITAIDVALSTDKRATLRTMLAVERIPAFAARMRALRAGAA
jgi:hypothetical protein